MSDSIVICAMLDTPVPGLAPAVAELTLPLYDKCNLPCSDHIPRSYVIASSAPT